MARFKNVRHKKKKRRKQPTAQDANEAYLKACREAADELFEKRGGISIERGIEAMMDTRELYHADVKRAREDESVRLRVTANAGIRIQRELERLEQRKEELMRECWAMARKMIDEHLSAQPAEESGEPAAQGGETLPKPEIHNDLPGDIRRDAPSPGDPPRRH